MVTTATDGKRVRGLRNRVTEAWERKDAPRTLPMPLQGLVVGKFLQAIEDWDMHEWERVTSGQGVGFVRSIRPTRQVVLDGVDEARDALERMGFGEPAEV